MILITTLGRAALFRKESYNRRTTPLIEWVVRVGDMTVRQCRTKRDAMPAATIDLPHLNTVQSLAKEN